MSFLQTLQINKIISDIFWLTFNGLLEGMYWALTIPLRVGQALIRKVVGLVTTILVGTIAGIFNVFMTIVGFVVNRIRWAMQYIWTGVYLMWLSVVNTVAYGIYVNFYCQLIMVFMVGIISLKEALWGSRINPPISEEVASQRVLLQRWFRSVRNNFSRRCLSRGQRGQAQSHPISVSDSIGPME